MNLKVISGKTSNYWLQGNLLIIRLFLFSAPYLEAQNTNTFPYHKFYLKAKHVQVIFVLLPPNQHQVLHHPGQVTSPVLHHHQVILRQLTDGQEQLGVAQQIQAFACGGNEEQELRLVTGQRVRVLCPHHSASLRAPHVGAAAVQQPHQLSALRLSLHTADTSPTEAFPRLSSYDDEKPLLDYSFGLHLNLFFHQYWI